MSMSRSVGVLLMCFALPTVARAQQGLQLLPGDSATAAATPIDPDAVPRPTIRAFHTTAPLAIDGRLEEPAWHNADSTWGFVSNLPHVGYPESEKTVVRILYDERNLYIGATLYDSHPDRLTISGLEQDFQTHDSDVFAISLDTYHDSQSAFLFATNPAGAIFDAQVFNDSRYVNREWEGVINVETATNEFGWTAEIAIPFTTLRFDRTDGDQTWGINFMRRIRRRNEDAYWAPLNRPYRVHKMSQAGSLQGLSGLRQGRNLTFKPYLSVGRRVGELRGDDRGNEVDAGIDVKYGITPRLTLDVTAFTDFSQVEVDQEQVNLTRFPLFFPEKRDFFMENAGSFNFGDVTERDYRMGSSLREFTLFHSRQIGLSEDRQPVPILMGGRLSGRAGDFEIGAIDVQTRESGATPGENFALARLRYTILGNSDVGLMLVNRQGTSEGATDQYNRSYGVDANFRLLEHMLINSYLAVTDEPNVVGDQNAARLQIAWRDPIWDLSGFAKHVGDAFNPAVGFVQRRNMRQLFATVGAHPQPPLAAIIEFNPYADLSLITNLEGTLETRSIKGGFGTTFLDGGVLSLEYVNQFERLLEPDVIAGVELPAGDYDFNDATVSYTSSGARRLSGRLSLSSGGFFDGSKTSVAVGGLFRPSHHLSLDVTAEHNELNLLDSTFTADVFAGRLRYAHSTRLFLSAFIQYNTSSQELVTNVRFNLIHAPLSDVFLVYTERRNVEMGTVMDRVLTAKVTRLFAF